MGVPTPGYNETGPYNIGGAQRIMLKVFFRLKMLI